MTLPNLSRLAAAATPRRLDGPYYGSSVDVDAGAALIAAAPQMAELLIACEEALRETLFAESRQCECVRCTAARDALARLADFDKELT